MTGSRARAAIGAVRSEYASLLAKSLRGARCAGLTRCESGAFLLAASIDRTERSVVAWTRCAHVLDLRSRRRATDRRRRLEPPLGRAPTQAPLAPPRCLSVDAPAPAPGLEDAAPPLGALPVDGGWSLRVWAPNASQVTVEGDFGSQALAPVDGGIFAGVVAGAVTGQHYGYLVVNGGESLARTDPRAPLVGADPGRQEPPGILYESTSFTWQSAAFTPPLDHAVIYEAPPRHLRS